MKIYAIYKGNDFIIGFPSREEAENYGKVVLGTQNGWEYNIVERWIYETKLYQFSQPLVQPISIPYTPPIPLKTTHYEPNIWCGNDGSVRATYDNGETK